MTRPPIDKGPKVLCPHCHSKTAIRGSRETGPLIRDIYYRCRNEMSCGHTFVCQLVVSHTIVPSARPNPAIVLPMYVPPQAKPKPANDDTVPPTPANDEDAEEAAGIVAAPS